MSSPRAAVSAVVAWLVVVAVGSTVVWLVISRAGDGISPAATPGIAPTTTQPTTQPATDRPTSHSSSGPTPQRRTWQGVGGLVTVECRGATISLVARSADVGFVVEPEKRGPDEVRVVFEGQGDEGRETSVRARCEDGVPVFEADTNGD
ncbi:hypothetical protein [Nocardioides aquiterrae]|uniref:Septum formation initiator n=1 Tax=Nocardioides aquiterrae TaxID=203799 RepID=A0ABN1UDC7_9ACTN